MSSEIANQNSSTKRSLNPWITGVLLALILLAASLFRFTGIYWGEYQYLHPDERFLVWVGTDISPVNSISEYFNTNTSSLNPHNRGHGFYVYGTFPMFITRYVVEWVFESSGFMEMTQVGRVLSSLMDLLTIILVYLIGERLYDRRIGLLGAAFSAAVVLQIQQSHFFTMDTFLTAFSMLAFYFAVLVAVPKGGAQTSPTGEEFAAHKALEADSNINNARHVSRSGRRLSQFVRDPLFLPSLGFGIALGMAVASKLDAAPMAIVLPAAMVIHLLRLPRQDRQERALWAFIHLVMAALVSILVFRILQPYAFSGPGFFGLLPNQKWIENIRSLLAQSSGDVDFPPAMQWARRSRLFSLKNMVLWGLGLPLGVLAWSGFVWAGWRMLNDWKEGSRVWLNHALIWGWTALYFIWQSVRLNSTMRYQLLIYPTLAIFASWAVFALYDLKRGPHKEAKTLDGSFSKGIVDLQTSRWTRIAAVLIGGFVLLSTYGYAFGFSRIYSRPITRVEASRWIYQNIPGPITLPIQTEEGTFNQSLPVPYSLRISPGIPYSHSFTPKVAGELSQVYLPRVYDELGSHEVRSLNISISPVPSSEGSTSTATLVDDLTPLDDQTGKSYHVNLDKPVTLDPERTYNLMIELPDSGTSPALTGQVALFIQPDTEVGDNTPIQQSLAPSTASIRIYEPYIGEFTPNTDGLITHLLLSQDDTQTNDVEGANLYLSLVLSGEDLATESSTLTIQGNPEASGYLLTLDTPLEVGQAKNYLLTLEMKPEGGVIALEGVAIANEGDWDDGLPLRLDGYDGFSGIYPPELNFNMYWDDNAEKVERFTRILDEADYIVISSSRQWASLPRIPERFPMTSVYYRELLGCPDDKSIEYCYNIAEPGVFQGNLGYELVKTFSSDPGVGTFTINDQFAEEAFTVYDHPKVFVFKKSEDYDPDRVRAILGAVDLSNVVRVPPMRATSRPSDLMLPDDRLAEQRKGGTWSELFNTDALHNRFQVLSVIVWYTSVSLLGLITFPLLRLALPGLADRGYPLARTAGMLILSYIVWLASSLRIPFSRSTISVVIILMAILGVFLTFRNRNEIREDLRRRWQYYMLIEGLMLAFFLGFLLVRLGNPDLWHPFKGGEKPMDFAYFNAVLKSTSFPPYDPWFAGGYLNYYYYGFVLVGVLVKWLGIMPAIAYNLILPTLFSLIAMGAFSITWNLSSNIKGEILQAIPLTPLITGVAGALGTALLGNLGTMRMIFQGYQKIVAPEGNIEGANLVIQWIWAIRGFIKMFLDSGVQMPYSVGDWYWLPSRAIPAQGDVEPITEFPYFTVLYGDPHAHLFALPLTLLAFGFIIAIVLGRGHWKNRLGGAAWFLLAGLTIGSLRPTNTWDLPPYLALGVVAVGYSLWTNYQASPRMRQLLIRDDDGVERLLRTLVALGGMVLLIGLTFLLFQPYADWYALGYNKIDLWRGTRTPISAYFTHWGLFLFLIISWMVWETREWMAKTPVHALRKLAPYRGLIQTAFILLLLLIILLSIPEELSIAGFSWSFSVPIAWFVIPLATWAGVLLLRPGQSDSKRIVLFLIGTGLVLTLMVELSVLVGDIGRMNWVFKFYLQVWTFFSISAAASLGWLIDFLPKWSPGWRRAWSAVLVIFVAGAALYPLMATMAKIKDRMATEAPHTLDGMAFMPYATYTDVWGPMELGEDYRAIRWMQENIKGSPVIVEANLRDLYRWGSRFSNYTGLPGVVGWEWHQQQQRAATPGFWVSDRIADIQEFYETTDWEIAANFLQKYDVRYIIVGQQERGKYPGPGLGKFDAAEGILWREVYREGNTVIYEVVET